MSVALATLLGLALAATGCATASPGGAESPAPAPAPGPRVDTPASTTQPITRWPVKTSLHLDLWLHSFAVISTDTIRVPLFRRGYRDSIADVKRRANVLTALDGNRAVLAQQLAASPAYMQAQFLPFEFASWEEMRTAAEQFIQFQGNPQRAPNQDVAMRIAPFAGIFTTPADREWLRLFVTGVQDEHTRFFAAEHARLVRERSAVVAAVDSLWQETYRAKFARFLSNTGQRSGDLVLSLPLGGEGRAGAGRERQSIIAVTWPGRPADAVQAILVFAHEATGTLVGSVVSDNTTPAEQRDGLADRYVSLGQVRAGAMLLTKTAPDLVDAYMRYYLAQSGVPVTGSLQATFERTYAVPQAVLDALGRQLEIVLGGI